MTARNDEGDRDQGGGDRPSQQGPGRQELIDQQASHQAQESLGAAASYQTRPDEELPERAQVTETGTAARSEEAAGLAAEPYHHDDADRAFRQSRGDRRPRED